MRAKAAKGLCSVSASCLNKGVVHGKVLIPACEIHRQSWLRNKLRQSRCRIDWENRASRRPRKGWGEGINNPDEMAACLSIVPVPSVIADLVRKIEQVNRTGDDLFFTDFKFVLLPERRDIAGMTAWHLPVEIAVVRLDGQVAIDSPIKYNQPISELLAGDPSAEGGRTWGTMQRIYGRGEETSR
jgi:hypothetical protein